jgi:hypothetical protein
MFTNTNLDGIMDLIFKKGFNMKDLWKGEKVINTRDLDTQLEEPTKELKSKMTDFVVNNFVTTPEQTENFLKTIFSSFNYCIDIYIKKYNLPPKSIFFIYKGGNILRLVALETENHFPKKVIEKVKKYYADSFKKSDADFSIYIDPNLEHFDKIFEDMTNMTFLVLNHLRNIFLSNPTEYFQYYKLSNVIKNELLKKQIDELNSTEVIKNRIIVKKDDMKTVSYNGDFVGLAFADNQVSLKERFISRQRDDFEIGFVEKFYVDDPSQKLGIKDTYRVALKHLHEDPKIPYNIFGGQEMLYGDKCCREIFLSLNRSTLFKKGNNLVHFNLLRAKFDFNALFLNIDRQTRVVKLDGELIDITIQNKNTTEIPHFMEHKDQYTAIYKVNNFEFLGYSLEYLISDLERILFIDSQYPWDDAKYAKRIKRALYLYFVMLLINKKFGPEDECFTNIELKPQSRKGYIDNIISIIGKVTQYFDEIDPTKRRYYKKKSIKKIRKYIRQIKKNCDEVRMNPFGVLIKKIVSILMEEGENDKFEEMIKLIRENLAIMTETLDEISNYGSKGPVLKENDLTEITL